jgi:phosphatidylglycerol:prolipoprotein diacylglycerol transferase
MNYIPFPDISPEIFSINFGSFTFALRWYALAYIAGLIAGWKIIVALVQNERLWSGKPPMVAEQVEQLLTWVIFGVILGGRLGYVLFYQPTYFLANPSEIVRVWEGGMSFHGGFLGVVVAGLLFCWRQNVPRLELADLMALVAPIGLFFGRIANFINAELWGRPTQMPWGVAFPGEAAQNCGQVLTVCARHPSQLYEALLEGLILFALLLYLALRRGWLQFPGRLAGVFFAGYGVSRFIVEFVRQPDALFVTPTNTLGYALELGASGLTMGQILSLPMILTGIWFMARARQR